MSYADIPLPISRQLPTAYIHQTSAAVYAAPKADSGEVVRLHEGNSVRILPDEGKANAGWLQVQTGTGQNGFMKANTKTITREALVEERAKIARGYSLGRGKMAMGGFIAFLGLALLIGPFLFSPQPHTMVVWYGAIAFGAAEFLWGLEQVTNVRRTLKKFDETWREAFA
jgi:hypothetical protein